ncbi:MAG: DUF1127 domain-containing protein [Reyranellales bacterium]
MSFQSRHHQIDRSNLLLTPFAPRPSLGQRVALTFAVWRQRARARRDLAQMDARSLRDIGISPAAAAFEAGKPFWERMSCLR